MNFHQLLPGLYAMDYEGLCCLFAKGYVVDENFGLYSEVEWSGEVESCFAYSSDLWQGNFFSEVVQKGRVYICNMPWVYATGIDESGLNFGAWVDVDEGVGSERMGVAVDDHDKILRNGVVAASSPGVAAGYSFYGEP